MTAKEFIKNFDILFFDMGRTFMFEADRFDKEQDYEKTYRSFGGKSLTNKKLHQIIFKIYGDLLKRSRDSELYDQMLTVEELIHTDNHYRDLPDEDKTIIEKTFAYHECGVIPETCKTTIRKLAESHKLGLISNVWCKSEYFKDKLKAEEVYNLFDIVIFSSDHSCVKPSRKIFNLAIDHFGKPPGEMVYIGDNYKRDVIGSKNAGMRSILVKNSESSTITGEVKPDRIISSITELA